jgi:hypothetical protein
VLLLTLRHLWADGWDLGEDSGNELTGAAVQLADDALDDMLDEAAERVGGMAETRLAQVADALEDDDGGPLDGLVRAIEQELGNEARALLVTQTETTWSMAEGMLGVFYQAGATTTAWATARDSRVCASCDANQAAGYLPIGEPFPSGATTPPGHVRCRCALLPGDIHGWSLPVPVPALMPPAMEMLTGR